ncbi:hypothetical protein B0H11DRAFT_2234398 [Mycena galericulata]|nr:hypothetical protein B0H11DRAFT_2234398 [Mycena galericulata]
MLPALPHDAIASSPSPIACASVDGHLRRGFGASFSAYTCRPSQYLDVLSAARGPCGCGTGLASFFSISSLAETPAPSRASPALAPRDTDKTVDPPALLSLLNAASCTNASARVPRGLHVPRSARAPRPLSVYASIPPDSRPALIPPMRVTMPGERAAGGAVALHCAGDLDVDVDVDVGVTGAETWGGESAKILDGRGEGGEPRRGGDDQGGVFFLSPRRRKHASHI